MIHLLLVILIIGIVLNFIGGIGFPAYRQGAYYGPSFGGILLLVVILYFLGFR